VDDPELRTALNARSRVDGNPGDLMKRARGRAIVSMAGAYGEDLETDSPWSHYRGPFDGDLVDALQLVNLLVNWESDEAAALMNQLIQEAHSVVYENRTSVRRLADVLEVERKLTGDRVAELLATHK
jgi:hypothetical protein